MKKNNSLSEEIKSEPVVFRRINSKFKEYWRYLFWLMAIYIVSYLVWLLILSKAARNFFSSRGWSKQWWMLLGVAIFQGLLFSLDGFVTAWLKAPFNQMCYAVNDASEEEITYNNKDYIIKRATESNEHCKETLKKFGILTITQELIRVFILHEELSEQYKKIGDYWYLNNVSYLIPLIFATIAVLSIHRKLKALRKNLPRYQQKTTQNQSLTK